MQYRNKAYNGLSVCQRLLGAIPVSLRVPRHLEFHVEIRHLVGRQPHTMHSESLAEVQPGTASERKVTVHPVLRFARGQCRLLAKNYQIRLEVSDVVRPRGCRHRPEVLSALDPGRIVYAYNDIRQLLKLPLPVGYDARIHCDHYHEEVATVGLSQIAEKST